jgi:hypothetical protein
LAFGIHTFDSGHKMMLPPIAQAQRQRADSLEQFLAEQRRQSFPVIEPLAQRRPAGPNGMQKGSSKDVALVSLLILTNN